MIYSFALAFLVQSEKVEDCVRFTVAIKKLGLPVTAAEVQDPKPNPEAVRNQKLAVEARELVKGRLQPRNDKRFCEIMSVLGQSKAPLFILSTDPTKSPTAFIVNKVSLLTLLEMAQKDLDSGRYASSREKLIMARRLSENKVWNESMIGWLTCNAIKQRYIAYLEKFKKRSLVEFKKFPSSTCQDFSYPNFQRLIRSDFVDTYSFLVGNKDLTRANFKAMSPETLKPVWVWLKNTTVMYPELKNPRNWTDLSRAYFNVLPEMEVFEDGEDQLTFTPVFCEGGVKLDQGYEKLNLKLRRLQS